MSWTVHRGSGRLLVITNRTGETVTSVQMTLQGKALGGMFGRRNWSMSLDEIADGDAVQAPFMRVDAAKADPPRIEVSWTSAGGERLYDVLDDLPL